MGRILSQYPTLGYIHEPLNRNIAKSYPGMFSVDVPTWYLYVTEENEGAYIEAFRRLMDFRYDIGAAVRRLGLADQTSTDYSDAEQSMLREYVRFLNCRLSHAIPLIKDPFAVMSLPWLVRRFGARPVVMIRHPAAFVASVRRQGGGFRLKNVLEQPLLMRDHPIPPYAGYTVTEIDQLDNHDVRKIAFGWRYIYSVVARYRAKNPVWLFVKHEDLARDPVNGFLQMFQTLGLRWSTEIERRIKAEAVEWRTSNPAATGVNNSATGNKLQGWKQHLSAAEIGHVRAISEDVASLFYNDDDW